MKTLTKVKLINWHMFVDTTVDIKNNTLITGQNGTGKSTLLDAIQYVLTAGNIKFNTAANQEGKRNLESYIRGKIGVEGKEYLRMGNVTSHIALEFSDEINNQTQIIGVLMTATETRSVTSRFYQIMNQKIEDNLFIADDVIYDMQLFKKNLDNHGISHEVRDQKRDAKNLFRQALGVDNKYFELIPKALAFQPISKVTDFIYSFLLEDDSVDITPLRDNVRNYRQLDSILKKQQIRLEYLEKINKAYEQVKRIKQNISRDQKVITYLMLDEMEDKIRKLEKQKDRDSQNQLTVNASLSGLRYETEQVNKERSIIEVQLKSNEGYRRKENLKQSIERLKNEQEKLLPHYQRFEEQLQEEQQILQKLRIQQKFSDYLKNTTDYDAAIIQENIRNLKVELSSIKESTGQKKFKIQNELIQINNKVAIKKSELDRLKNKRLAYPQHVVELISILKIELKKAFKTIVEVKPFCEYLEIIDESWRNAIEGYLNTQRFNLIIEPIYYNKAIQLYKQYKDEKGIFGVGIVDVAKLIKYDQFAEQTLASKITTEFSHARKYANFLLNKVHCVDEVIELRNHKISLTKSCMLYKNYTTSSINPKTYKKPFIGQHALEKQLFDAENEYTQFLEQHQVTQKKLNEIEQKEALLNKSNIEQLNATINVLDDMKQNKETLNRQEQQLAEIRVDDSWVTLEKQYLEIEKDYQQKNQTLISLEREKISLDNSLEFTEKQLSEYFTKQFNLVQEKKVILEEAIGILPVIETRVKEYKDKYKTDFVKMYAVLNKYRSELEGKIITSEHNVQVAMNQFNTIAEMGYEESIENISLYQNIYYKIRDIEITKNREAVLQAQKKCEISFQEGFVSQLREKINKAKENLKELNKALKEHDFGGESYQFVYSGSKNPAFSQYYEIINSGNDYLGDNLFVSTLSAPDKQIMDELFERLNFLDDNSNNEKILQEYTDYRRYMDYDIIITNRNGAQHRFSKVNNEKSGGETQIPFYVIIAASFALLMKRNSRVEPGCVALFDEAFSNMDEIRIATMMQYFKMLNVQIILAVPPLRMGTIIEHVEKTILTIKDENYHTYVKDFSKIGEELENIL